MLEKLFAVRLTEEQQKRLESIASQTGRTRSQVIRLLIERVSAGEPDLRLEAKNLSEEHQDGRDGS